MPAPRNPRQPGAPAETALGGFIKERRSAQGVSQAQLADRAGMSRSYLCDLERGRGKQPSMKILQELARALGEDPDELLRQAGLIQRSPDRGDDGQERRVLAVYRSLSEQGREAVERFARFLHNDEQRWTQPILVTSDDLEVGRRVTQTGPTLFDAMDGRAR